MKFFYKAVLIFILIICIFAFSGCSNDIEKTTTKNWMKDIKDEVFLKDIVMPGSHDAGTYGDFPWGETQDKTIGEQLKLGARYFDIRVMKTSDEDGGSYENIKIYHMNATPNTFLGVCSDIRNFIEENPSEFLVLDLQHFRNQPYQEVIEIIEENLNPNEFALKNTNDISNLTMGNIREQGTRYMIIWGYLEPYNEYKTEYLFFRDDVLQSPYNAEWQSGTDEYLIGTAFDRYYESRNQNQLFVLQAQKTGKDAQTLVPKANEEVLSPKVSEFVKNLKDDSRLNQTNIIMRDYLNKEKCLEIIELNTYKNNIKEKNKQSFEEIE